MTEYVAGFMLEKDTDRVALVLKNRPAWQAGKMNGVGGHIEPGETPKQAMVREFLEETGYSTAESEWENFTTLFGDDWRVHFFSSEGRIDELKSTTDEEIVLVSFSQINVKNAIPNLTWLIPMAKSMMYDRAKHFEIQEKY